MYTRDALLDLHIRAHRSLERLLQHCRGLSSDDLDRELDGFGYPSVRLQLHHVIEAEEYWMSVLRGKYEVNDNSAQYPTISSLESYREEIATATRASLDAMSEETLNTPRELLTWPDKLRTLVPARVMMRFITHIYQHQGQVAAQCRLLGSPIPPGLDFPLD